MKVRCSSECFSQLYSYDFQIVLTSPGFARAVSRHRIPFVLRGESSIQYDKASIHSNASLIVSMN